MAKSENFLEKLQLYNLHSLSEKARWLIQKGSIKEKFSYRLLHQFYIDFYQNLGTIRDREVFLDQFFHRFSKAFDVEMGALFLRDPKSKKKPITLNSKKVLGLSSKKRVLSENQKEFAFLVRSNTPILWDKYHLNPAIHEILSKKELPKSRFFLYIPFWFSGKVFGSLLLLNISNCTIYSVDQSEVEILSLLVCTLSYPLYLLSEKLNQ